jgi:diguanylate cyclase (GGDEF)-like protein
MALLWLQLLTIAIGAAYFVFVPSKLQLPMLAVGAVAVLGTAGLMLHIIPALRQSMTRQQSINIATLLVGITLLVAATGADRSELLPLYCIPLASMALAFGRWWLVLLLGVLIGAVIVLLGRFTPEINIASAEFAVWLMSELAPSVAVALVMAVLIERVQTSAQRISDLASTDALTGLLNMRAFEHVLQQEHRKCERFGRPYTLVLVEIDEFAPLNESLGHQASNEVIVSVAAAIGQSIRNSDVAARLSGHDFIVLLTEADSTMGATIAQRIRNHVFSATVSVANRLIRANASVGTASFPEDHLYAKELMSMASQRMRQDRELRRVNAIG